MCLTEPHAGSDVGASTTRAVRQDDGTYLISGEKIFITSGEHDLADNIIHAVLARTPEAPLGTRGLSLFVVPKRWVEADGSTGADNDVACASVEHKLGIHASPTCVVSFGDDGDGAVGYLLGEEQKGMRNMFTMMNVARIGGSERPLARDESAFRALYDERQPVYEAVADGRARDPDDAVLHAAGIHVGVGAVDELGELIPGDGTVEIVVDRHVSGIP
jgi:acyl-CoA dehydrogenase